MDYEEKKEYIVFGSPKIEEDEIEEVVDSMRSGWLGTGPKVTKFQDLMNEYVGSQHAAALNSCTAALHLSLLVCGVGPGDEIITTPLTFCATVNAIIHTGATPVFVDVDRKTMNIDENKIELAITKKTKAIIPVHMAGRPCEMDTILAIAKKHGLYVIEDAAHALGATYKGKKIGSISDLTCFSFYVTKNIVTGEGGMVTTDNEEFINKIRIYSLHGMTKDAWKRYSDDGYKHYQVVVPGFKYNMMDLQAAIGIHQIKRIDEYDKKRQILWDFYDEELKELSIELPAPTPTHMYNAKHLYTILVDKERTGITRDEFMQKMHEEGIGTGVHFIPVHLHPYYMNKYGYTYGHFPNAEYIGDRTVSIPFSAKLTIDEAKRIVDSIKLILSHKK